MNALVMYDTQTDTLWSQFLGEAVEGPMAGTRLEMLPSQLITYGAWKDRHPDTLVLEKSPYGINVYQDDEDRGDPGPTIDPYLSYYLSGSAGVIGESNVDDRLSTKELVVGIAGEASQKAYAYRHLSESTVVNDTLEGRNLLVAFNLDTFETGVFDRDLNGQTLTFDQSDDPVVMIDRETGSSWLKATGDAVKGSLKGSRLEQLPYFSVFWFAWTDFHPETELYEPVTNS